MVCHSASSRFAVFFLGLSNRRIAYSCIDLFRLFSPFLPRGRREDSLFAPSFSPGRARESAEGEEIVAIVARSGQKSL